VSFGVEDLNTPVGFITCSFLLKMISKIATPVSQVEGDTASALRQNNSCPVPTD
jgi:hypothetical protein